MASVAVVIRCLNEERHIGRLLAGLDRQTRRPDEIVIVDSGSTDATVEIARHYDTTVVHISREEFSFGRALNLGCAAASADLCVIMSAHVYPLYVNYIERLTAPLDDENVALAYGRQVGDRRTRYSESRVMLRWFPAESTPRQSHAFCNNANAVIRRNLWEILPYDEQLTGLEDVEWAGRARAKGFAVSYAADAPIVHVHEESWRTIVNRYRREAYAYKQIVPHQRRMTAIEAMGLAVGNTVVDYMHAAHDRVLARNLVSIPFFRASQFYGAWSGYRRTHRLDEELRRRFYYPLEAAPPVLPEPAGGLIDYDSPVEASPPSPRAELHPRTGSTAEGI